MDMQERWRKMVRANPYEKLVQELKRSGELFKPKGDHRDRCSIPAGSLFDCRRERCRGIYRQTHNPDGTICHQEKFYFTPGYTGFRAFKTRYGTIGGRNLLGSVVSGDGKRHGTKRGGTPFLSNCNRKRADTWLRQYAALETVHDGACGM